jgi:integrase
VLDPFAIAAIRLLILTGARLREILDAQWQQVDFERGILFLPDSKTGRKPIYLSAPAIQVLASLPRLEVNPHIIAGPKDGAPRADLKKPWAAITKAAGLEGVRLHDLRHSFASVGAGASLRAADHRQTSRPHASRDYTPLCTSRRRSNAASGRNHWCHDRGGHGRGSLECRADGEITIESAWRG